MPYHPQCHRLVEQLNRTLLNILAAWVEDHLFDWEQYLQNVRKAYNTSIQSSTGFLHLYVMFGQQAKLPVDLMYGTGKQEEEGQSVGEYTVPLKTKMSTPFAIVSKNLSKYHVYQKEHQH